MILSSDVQSIARLLHRRSTSAEGPTNVECRVSSLKTRVSSLINRVSSLENRVSSIVSAASTMELMSALLPLHLQTASPQPCPPGKD